MIKQIPEIGGSIRIPSQWSPATLPLRSYLVKNEELPWKGKEQPLSKPPVDDDPNSTSDPGMYKTLGSATYLKASLDFTDQLGSVEFSDIEW